MSLPPHFLLALAIGVGVPRPAIIAPTSFFLVGAAIGLFNRLYLDASAQTAVEDYGLSIARLIHTPLFSGLAAVGGVLIIPMLSVLINPPADAGKNIVAPALVVPRQEPESRSTISENGHDVIYALEHSPAAKQQVQLGHLI